MSNLLDTDMHLFLGHLLQSGFDQIDPFALPPDNDARLRGMQRRLYPSSRTLDLHVRDGGLREFREIPLIGLAGIGEQSVLLDGTAYFVVFIEGVRETFGREIPLALPVPNDADSKSDRMYFLSHACYSSSVEVGAPISSVWSAVLAPCSPSG